MILDPTLHDWSEWSTRFYEGYASAGVAQPPSVESEWRPWAERVVEAGPNVMPVPHLFPTWRDWAMELLHSETVG